MNKYDRDESGCTLDLGDTENEYRIGRTAQRRVRRRNCATPIGHYTIRDMSRVTSSASLLLPCTRYITLLFVVPFSTCALINAPSLGHWPTRSRTLPFVRYCAPSSCRSSQLGLGRQTLPGTSTNLSAARISVRSGALLSHFLPPS